MAIEFHCTQCDNPLRGPEALVGKAIRCPHCKSVQTVPDAAKAKARALTRKAANPKSVNTGIDWNLMAEAAKKTVDLSDADEHKDPDAIDWNAIAGGGAPAAPGAKPTKSGKAAQPAHAERFADEPAPSLASIIDQQADEEIEARSAVTGGRFDKFAVDAIAAIPYSGNYLIQILLIVILIFVMGIVLPILAMGVASLLENMPHRQIAIGMSVLLAIPQLVVIGYLSLVWLEVAHTTADDTQAFGVPDFTIGGSIQALLMFGLFVIVYIAPIVTIPLAPMAFLVLCRTQDSRAFDMGYVGRLTLQHAGYVGLVLAISIGAVIACYLVAAGLFPVIAKFSLSMIESLSIEACDIVAAQSTLLLVSPVLILVATGMARMSGLIGKHNPHIFTFMPARRNFSASLGYGVTAAVAAVIIIPAILINSDMASSLASRFVASNVLDPADIRRGPVTPTGTGTTPTGPYTGPYTPGTTPPVGPDLSKLGPDELLVHHVQQLRSPDPVRQQEAIMHLEQATPNDKRAEVLTALEQFVEQSFNPILSAAALKAHAAWNNDPVRGAMVRMRSKDRGQRLTGLKQLPELERSEEAWKKLSPMIDQILATESDAEIVGAAISALLVWHKEPETRLALELDANRPSSAAIIAALGTPGNEKAVPVLVRHVSQQSALRAAAADALIKIGPVAEPAVIDLLSVNLGEGTRTAAARILEAIGTAKSVDALKTASADASPTVADAARKALQKVAPEQFSAVELLLLDIERNLGRPGGANKTLIELKAIDPNDKDRTRVIQVMLKLLTAANSRATLPGVDPVNNFGPPRPVRVIVPLDAIDILAAWADDDGIALLIKALEADGAADMTLRRNLFLVFGKIKSAKPVVAISKWLLQDLEAQSALVTIGAPAEDHMIRLLDTSNDDQIKMSAIRVMEKVGGPKSIARLTPLSRQRVNSSLRFAAANAILTIQNRIK